MMIPEEVAARMAHIANQQGLRGRKVIVQWVPPQYAHENYMGSFLVIDDHPKSAAELLFD
jgi:hypothetical protein